MTQTKKQIGGPGYVGNYIIVEFKKGASKGIENCDTDWENLNDIVSRYDNVRQACSFEKTEPFISATQIAKWK